jgi:hypothetical protein
VHFQLHAAACGLQACKPAGSIRACWRPASVAPTTVPAAYCRCLPWRGRTGSWRGPWRGRWGRTCPWPRCWKRAATGRGAARRSSRSRTPYASCGRSGCALLCALGAGSGFGKLEGGL